MLNRSVENSRSGEAMAAMHGTASFIVTSENEALYSESVTLALESGHAMPATRRYFYRHESDGLAIYFDEARENLFHRLLLEEADGGLTAADRHLCSPDRYDSRYEFLADGTFRVTHVVDGPRKSYVSRTVYVRQAGAAS